VTSKINETKTMQEITKDIINFASAEGGRILVADKEIRLFFPDRDKSVRFMTAISDKHPSVKLKTCSLWKNVDVSGEGLFDIARAS